MEGIPCVRVSFVVSFLCASLTSFSFASASEPSRSDVDCEQQLAERPAITPESALKSFQAFFKAIKTEMLEREQIVDQISAALLAREHLLMMGPPGNAKSMIADAVLGNITNAKGERSYYRIQMTPETTMSETHGPISPKDVFESGRIVRHYDQGMLFSRHVFIDEIFDGRANAQRNILGLLAERQHAQGTEIIAGQIATAIAASNQYLDEVYERAGNQGPKALLDRFSFSVYVPGEFQFSDSYQKLIGMTSKEGSSLPKLTFEELDALSALTKKVEIPPSVAHFLALLSYRLRAHTEAMEQASLKMYRKKLQNGENPPPPYRATKYHSPRTLFKAAKILRAMVVQDWIHKEGKRSLVASIEDVEKLRSFFTLSGPSIEFAQDLLERTVNPYERSQLQAILDENALFDEQFDEIAREMNEVVYQYALTDLDEEVAGAATQAQKDALIHKLTNQLVEIRANYTTALEQASQTGKDIGYNLVADFFEQRLRQLMGENFDKLIGGKIQELLKEKEERLAVEQERVRREEAEQRRQMREAARQKAEALRNKKIAKLMGERMESVFAAPEKYLEVIGQIETESESPPTNNQSRRETFHVSLGEQALILPSGEGGLRLRANGSVEKIEYVKAIENEVLRQTLVGEGERVIFAVDANTFAVQTGSLLFLVDANSFTVKRAQMLKYGSAFAHTADGRFILQIDGNRNIITRFDILTGKGTDIAISGLGSSMQTMRPSDIWMAPNENTLIHTRENATYRVKFDLSAGYAETASWTNNGNRGFNLVLPSRDQSQMVLVSSQTNQSFIVGTKVSTFSGQGNNHTVGSGGPFMDCQLSTDGNYLIGIPQGSNHIAAIKIGPTWKALPSPRLVNDHELNQPHSLSWVDNQTLVYKFLNFEGRIVYRVFRIKPPSEDEINSIPDSAVEGD